MHHKYSMLLKRNEARLQRHRWRLIAFENKRRLLCEEKQIMESEILTLREMIRSHDFTKVKDRAGLFTEQRKLAVLRRRMFSTIQKHQAAAEEINNIELQIIDFRQVLHKILHRSEKYKYLLVAALAMRTKIQSQQEETETEEIILWKK